jgi:hypothetical protein
VVSGTITFRGAPSAAPLQLQVKPSLGSTWTTVASTTATAKGTFSTSIPAQPTNYDWRVVIPSDGLTRLSASVSGSAKVKLGITAHALTSTKVGAVPSVAIGAKPSFVGVTSPKVAGVRVVLRQFRNNAWATVATFITKANGAFTLVGSAQTKGAIKYQIVAVPPSGQPNATGSTPVLTVTSK